MDSFARFLRRRFPGHHFDCRRFGRTSLVAVAVGGLLFLLGRPAEGAVVYGTPGGVTAQPTDDPLWNSTVQWTLQNGGGTIIGPHSVLTAQHLNPSIGATLSLTTVTGVGPVTNTQTYTTTATTYIPNTDLAVWTVSGTFPSSSIVPAPACISSPSP